MKTFLPPLLAGLLLLMAGPSLVHAQDRAPEILVLGAGYLADYPGSDDSRYVPLLISRAWLRDVRFEFDGTEARFDLNRDPVLRAGPLVNLVLPRDDNVLSASVAALPALDPIAEIGGYLGFERPFGRLREGALSGFIALRTDATSSSHGSVVRGNLEYFFALARPLRLSLSLDVHLADQKHMETWFGISPAASSASGLAAYQPDAGIRDVGLSLNTIFSFNRSIGIYTRVSYARLSEQAANSPLVRDEGTANQWFAAAGLFLNY